MPDRDLVFFSYRHDDEGQRWLSLVHGVLEPYFGLSESLVAWSDRDIRVGEQWHARILGAIERTRVAVLLVNHWFFASKYISQQELPRLVADARAGRLTLVGVLIGPVGDGLLAQHGLADFQFSDDLSATPLGALEGYPRQVALVHLANKIVKAYGTAVEAVMASPVPALAGRQGMPIVEASVRVSEVHVPGRLLEVPSLPRHFVARDDELKVIRTQLLHGHDITHGLSAAPGFGLHGMGGMGKSVMAQALCHDAEVGIAFPDGIAWMTLGQQPDMLALQNQLLRHFTPAAALATSIAEARQQLREALDQRRVMIVLDDIWDARHFEPFDVVGPQGRVLLTTRDASILPQVGARLHPLHSLSLAPALELLARWSGCPVGQLPEAASQVVDLTHGLPLALALAGAQVADGVSCSTLVEQLRQGRLDFLDHPYASVYASLGRSFDYLPDTERERYLELAVFPEDVAVAQAVVARLWQYTGGLDAAATEKLLARLERKALLSLAGEARHRSITLHDLQRDFLRLRCDDLPALHQRLLDAYRHAFQLPAGGPGWARLPPDEPYLWRRLAMHLAAAGRPHELEAALLDFGWIAARLASETRRQNGRQVTDIAALQPDYETFLTAAPDVELVGRVIKTSAHVLAQHPQALAQQLFGRLGQHTQGPLHALANAARLHLAQHDAWLPMRVALASPGTTLQVCAGHEAEVSGALVLPDGRRVLSWSGDRTLRLWDLEQPGTEPRVLAGHEDAVNGALVLPDGQQVLSWSWDSTLRLWNLEQPLAQPRVLAGHEGWVKGALVLPNGQRALSWSEDRTLRLWDLEQPLAQPQVLAGHEDTIWGAQVLPDGRRALSWSEDRTLRLWDLEQPLAQPRVLAGHKGAVWGVQVLPDGRRALSWSADCTLRLWDLERPNAEPRVLAGHEDAVNGALVLPNIHCVLSWSDDCTLRLWDFEQLLAEPRVLTGHRAEVSGVLGLPDGRRALSWSEDRTLRLWNLEQPLAQPRVLAEHETEVSGALVLPDGRRVLSWLEDGTLQRLDLEQPLAQPQVLAGHEGAVNGALVLPDGRRALSWSRDRTLRLWDLEQPLAQPQVLAGHESSVYGALALPDGRRALSWSFDQTLRLWDLEQPHAQPRVPAGEEVTVRGALVLPDGQRALFWSKDGTLRLWDLEQPLAQSRVLAGHEATLNGALALPDGRQALSWSRDRTLRLWDLEQPGTKPWVLAGHEDSVWGALVLPNGRQALSWSGDRTLRLWDLEQPGTELRVLAGHEDSVWGALVLPNGRQVLSWSGDLTLRLWNLEQPLAQPQVLAGHEAALNGVLALPDGRQALSWSRDRTLRLWNLEQPLAQPRVLAGHKGAVWGVLVLPDGRQALSWSGDHTLRLWDLEQPHAQPRVFDGHEEAVTGALVLPDGQRALSWSRDRTLRLWDLSNSSELACYFADAGVTVAVSASDGHYIFIGDALGYVQILQMNAQ